MGILFFFKKVMEALKKGGRDKAGGILLMICPQYWAYLKNTKSTTLSSVYILHNF